MWIMRMFVVLVGLVFVGSPPWVIDAFNIETKHYAVYRNEAKSMFGFAVSTYRDRQGRGWAIVGAPEAETSQVGVYRGGAVFRCDIAADDSCDTIHFDDKGNNHIRNPNAPGGLSQIDNKTMQWFGATVSASMKDGGPILACAPRYIWFSTSQPRYDPDDYRWTKEATVGNRREPVGTCWVVNSNFTESVEYSPCRTRFWGYHRQGSCQAGLGAAVAKGGERAFIGAPGSWYWQGQAFSQPLGSRAKVMYTKEGPATEDDSYMGYSVTTGDFVGNGDSGTAIGVPRGSGLRGKVVLFTSNMTNHQNVTGEQMGAYFGYAVAAGDIDGDGLDDLIIGAPMYTIPSNPEMTIETGRVYVIYQGTGSEKFRKVDSRDGESNRGRFGLSLASLGDIDRDGYGDFAVGAPYGGPNNRGIVYIYHGSRNGVLEKYSQVIHAEDLDTPVQTFGFSLAGGLDLDGNRYPDMVVGAYESSTAMFFRARPVIKMDSFVTFASESKLISLDNRNCTLSDGTRVTCLPLRTCFEYNGDGVPSRHDFNIQYVLDVKKTKNPRLFFLELEGRNIMNHTITATRGRQFCRTVQVYITPNIRDKLTSLDAEMRMSLKEERVVQAQRRFPRMPLTPVLGTTTSMKDSLSIRKNCGSDNVCIPDLQLTVQPNVAKYLLGSGKKLELEILVQNDGEDAFEATYSLQLPPGIDYIKIERIDKTEVPVQCSAPKQSNNNTLRCDIGNPLPRRQLVHFNVLLQPVTSHGMKPSYDFHMRVNTTNPEEQNTTDDNVRYISLPIWIETELLLIGESKPKDLYYNPDNYTAENITTELEFGPAMTHNYTIQNQGPSDILEAEVFLVWPAQTLAGDELVYLLEQPETSGSVVCGTANANYLSLKLDPRRRIHVSYPDPSGVILDESQSGKTINVQRGFATQSEHNKLNQKEDTEIHIGDSSSIQKSRHSSSSSSSNVVTSETRRIQLTSSGDNSGVVTTYTQNSSGTNSGAPNVGDLSRGGSGLIIHESGTVGSETVVGGFPTTIHPHAFPPNSPNIDVRGRGRFNETEYESRWGETHVVGHSSSSASGRAGPGVYTEKDESERRYQELLRLQEEQRRRQEEETFRREEEERARRIQEERRLALQRRREDEERLALQRQREEQERLAVQRQREEEMRRRQQQERQNEYDEERLHGSGYGRDSGLITGDREEVIGGAELGFRLRNVTSAQDLDKFFGTLSKEATGYETYSRQGRQYVQFRGRFTTAADRREYIEFQDGSMFPLQDQYGRQSYALDGSDQRDTRFLRIEGQLMVAQDGRGFIVLKDARRFPLQGSYTYTEERTYTIGGSRDGDNDRGVKSHGQSWHEEYAGRDRGVDKDYDNTYSTRSYEERKTEERRTEEHRLNTRIYGRENRGSEGGDAADSKADPNLVNSRFRRSDMVNVEDFKRFERRHRHPRDADEDRLSSRDTSRAEESIRRLKEDDAEPKKDVSLCDSANCVTLHCVLGPLKKNEEVWIGARYRVNARTLKKIAYKEKVKVSTQLVARVTKQPFIGTPAEQVIKSYETFTNVEPSVTSSAPDIIPIWVVVPSACAGTIILLLLIYLLHKCGFFKRNRPSDAPERQPLNRNGHFQHGDDH